MDAGPSRQRRALRPSQRRLDEGQHVDLPPRLQHLARLPWLECYLQQLRTEGKSENTRKTYLTSIRPLLDTTLPGEIAPDDVDALCVAEVAERVEPLNGRVDRWVHLSLIHI